MRQVQHLALDKDKWANELIEEALQDLLKKYACAKRKAECWACDTWEELLSARYARKDIAWMKRGQLNDS